MIELNNRPDRAPHEKRAAEQIAAAAASRDLNAQALHFEMAAVHLAAAR